jgi:PAS domain S-box-containing protein
MAVARSAKQLQRALDVQRRSGRQQAEEWLDARSALEATLGRYVRLFDEAPVGYLTLDDKGRITDINRAATEMIGVARDRLRGKPFLACVARGQAKIFADHLRRCALGFSSTELELGRRGHATIPVRLDSRCDATRLAHEPSYYTVITDIREQRQREAALRASEKRHREIVETASEGICIVNEHHEIVFANRRLGWLVGRPPEALVGRSALELFADTDVERAARAFEGRDVGVNGQSEQLLKRVDGTTIRTSVSTTVMRDDHGCFTGMLRMYTDTTARHELAESRQVIVRQLIAAQELERHRIARELHDQLGQHIVGLSLGLARLATLTADNDDAQQLLRLLQQSADLMGKDVHTLALELRPSTLDHLGLATALRGYVEEVAERTGLEADVHCDALTGIELDLAIQTGLYRVAQEAITNVVKHARARHVSVVLERRGDDLQLIVEDDGRGFEPSKLEMTGASKLGLAGMRERAAIMGGTLTIESSPRKGSSVFIRIPLPLPRRNEHEQKTPPTSG